METTSQTVEQSQYLTFFIGEEEYAAGILRVKEIIQYDTVTKVPTTPPWICGVINLRGGVVPVVDLAVKLGLPETKITSATCIVITEVKLQGEQSVMGVLADSVSQVIELRPPWYAVFPLDFFSELLVPTGWTDTHQLQAELQPGLSRIPAPEQDLHEKAHKLEHISDQATVEYLDDKLGHPIADPHGSVIPTDASLARSKRDFVSSLLRDGNQAEIRKIAPLAQPFGLAPGDHVTMGKRSSDGKVWKLITADGRQIQLNHDQADAIIVRIIES